MFEQSKERLTPDNILKYVDQWEIIKTYVPQATMDKLFFTPFGDETNPSTSIMKASDGTLLMKDFGSSLPAMNCFRIVQELYKLPFPDALEKIRLDFGLDNIESYGNVVPSKRKVYRSSNIPDVEVKSSKTILVRYRDWDLNDKKFWEDKYCIKKSTLIQCGVFPISNFWIDNKHFVADKLSYVYKYFKSEDNRYIVKIYQPYSKLKWVSNSGHLQVIQGEGALPKTGELLIITSSLKDVMVLKELGYNAIAPQSETTMINRTYFNKQQTRFNKIIVFFDADEGGINAAAKYREQYRINSIVIPKFYYNEFGIKDISDFISKFGYENTKVIMKNLLHAI